MQSQTSKLPTISVVVPSFNHGRFIRQTLESIFTQGYPCLEVIVMDGGSTDESVDIIREYSSRLTYWQSQRDGGQSAAINAGMRHCTGDLVTWLNSDDYFWNDSLWVVGRAFADHPGRGLYIGNGFRFDQETGQYLAFCTRHIALNREALRHGPDYLLQPSTFMLRKAWEEAGGLNPDLHYVMDWDVFLRIADRHSAVIINEFLAVSREYQETKTRSGRLKRAFEIIELMRRHSGDELTAGSLMFLLDAVRDASTRLDVEGLESSLYSSIGAVAVHISRRWGGGHGFPEFGDPQDVVFLPRAGNDSVQSLAYPPYDWPAVSIIIPCESESHLLDVTLQSIVGQCYPGRVEVLIVPWGDYEDGEPRVFMEQVRWLPQTESTWQSAVGRGLQLSSGDLCAVLHPGDALTSDSLAVAGKRFGQVPELQSLYANAVHIDQAQQVRLPSFNGIRNAFWMGQLPDRSELTAPPDLPRPLPLATLFFRKKCGERWIRALPVPAAYSEYAFIDAIVSQGRVDKLERTQALCCLRSFDRQAWLEAWYRANRIAWPRWFTANFLRTIRNYAKNHFQRKPVGKAGKWPRRLRVAGIMLTAALRIGNPEKRRPQRSARICDSPNYVGERPVRNLPEEVELFDFRSWLELTSLDGRPYRSLLCGPIVHSRLSSDEKELHEYRLLHQLARLSSLCYFAYRPGGRDDWSRRKHDFIDVIYTPERLTSEIPQLVLRRELRTGWKRRLSVLLRKLNLPVIGCRQPFLVGKDLNLVFGYSRLAIDIALHQRSWDFLWLTPETNPLILRLCNRPPKARYILMLHQLQSLEMIDQSRKGGWLNRLHYRLETKRWRRYEERYFSAFDGVIVPSAEVAHQVQQVHNYPADRIFINAMDKGARAHSFEHLWNWLEALRQMPNVVDGLPAIAQPGDTRKQAV